MREAVAADKAERAAARRGLTFRIVPAAAVPVVLDELEAISAEWMASKGHAEKSFSLGHFSRHYLQRFDVALVMDVTHATDYPTVDKRQHGDIKVGQGPTVTHGNCNHPEVIKRVEQVAKRLKITLQHEAISATSGTDTDAVFWTRGGIPSGLISLPNRYMHSPVEVVSLKDLEQIPQLMAGFAKSLKKGDKFKVKI